MAGKHKGPQGAFCVSRYAICRGNVYVQSGVESSYGDDISADVVLVELSLGVSSHQYKWHFTLFPYKAIVMYIANLFLECVGV